MIDDDDNDGADCQESCCVDSDGRRLPDSGAINCGGPCCPPRVNNVLTHNS